MAFNAGTYDMFHFIYLISDQRDKLHKVNNSVWLVLTADFSVDDIILSPKNQIECGGCLWERAFLDSWAY